MTPERIEQERKAFEWWISNPAPPVPIDPCQKQKDGRYAYDHIEFAWRVWQARAAQSGWISVEDRLPEIGARVLLCGRYENQVIIAYCATGYFDGITYREHWGADINSMAEVTHWQPLPEPPAEQSDA